MAVVRDFRLVVPALAVAAGVAGLLNLLCIFDATMLAAMGVRGEPHRQRETQEGEA